MKPDARIRFFSLSLSGQPIMPAIEASHSTMEIRLGTIQVLTQTLLNTAARQASTGSRPGTTWRPSSRMHGRGNEQNGVRPRSTRPE